MSDYQNAQLAQKQQQSGLISNGLADYGKALQAIQREPVSHQDLIDMSMKLQEALSLITQALGRMR